MAADLTLLREVIAWGRANGWRPSGRDRISRPAGGPLYWRREKTELISAEYDQDFVWVDAVVFTGVISPSIRANVHNLREAVDVLVALGVLPARFSCAYNTGWNDGRAAAIVGCEEVYGFLNGHIMPISRQDATAIKGSRERLYRAYRTQWERVPDGD